MCPLFTLLCAGYLSYWSTTEGHVDSSVILITRHIADKIHTTQKVEHTKYTYGKMTITHWYWLYIVIIYKLSIFIQMFNIFSFCHSPMHCLTWRNWG